jgi:hypothetical protein
LKKPNDTGKHKTPKLWNNKALKKLIQKNNFTNLKSFLFQLLELIISFAIVITLHLTSVISSSVTIVFLVAFIFIWSARYGLLPFLVSISIFHLLLLTLFEQVQNIGGLSLNTISIFTIVVGLIIGIIGEMLNKKLRDLQNNKKRLELENQKLLSAIGDMRVVISQLQMRIYFEGEGLIVLLERLRELEILNVDEMLTRAVEIIAEFFELENLHLYRCEGNFLRYVAGIGQKRLPNSLDTTKSSVIYDALQNGYSTLPKVILKADITSFEPWFAVVIGEKSNAFGVFVVEDVSPEKFSETLVKYISAVAGWLYANVRTILQEEKALEEVYKKPDGTWDENYYIKKKKVFEKRKERFGIPYEELCITYKSEYHNSIVNTFRKSDVLVAYPTNGKIVLRALLAVCDAQGKAKILERLVNKYEIEVF